MKEKIIESILDLIILQLLRDNSINSNQITKEINRQFGIHTNSATLHANLTKLENENLITQTSWKSYKLTQQGEKIREQMKKSYLSLQKDIEQQLKKG